MYPGKDQKSGVVDDQMEILFSCRVSIDFLMGFGLSVVFTTLFGQLSFSFKTVQTHLVAG